MLFWDNAALMKFSVHRFERNELAVLAGITAAHLVVAVLLITALVRGKVITRPQGIELLSIAEETAPPTLLPPSELQQVPTAIEAPSIEVRPTSPAVEARMSDPFAGASLVSANSATPIEPDRFLGPATAAGPLRSTGSEWSDADATWLADLQTRFAGRRAADGRVLKPVVVEVLARPGGGFNDIRLQSTTGSPDVDQLLLAAIMLRQALVPPGMVAMTRWLPLPLIELRDEPTRSDELDVDRVTASATATEGTAAAVVG